MNNATCIRSPTCVGWFSALNFGNGSLVFLEVYLYKRNQSLTKSFLQHLKVIFILSYISVDLPYAIEYTNVHTYS